MSLLLLFTGAAGAGPSPLTGRVHAREDSVGGIATSREGGHGLPGTGGSGIARSGGHGSTTTGGTGGLS